MKRAGEGSVLKARYWSTAARALGEMITTRSFRRLPITTTCSRCQSLRSSVSASEICGLSGARIFRLHVSGARIGGCWSTKIAMVIPTDTQAGLRDRALLLLGFSSGRRRSELVALDVEDLRDVPEGYRVLVRCSKTDQEGEGQEIGIPYGHHSETCPVTALKAYLKAAAPRDGSPLPPGQPERRAQEGLQRRGRVLAGLSPADFAGRSLRG